MACCFPAPRSPLSFCVQWRPPLLSDRCCWASSIMAGWEGTAGPRRLPRRVSRRPRWDSSRLCPSMGLFCSVRPGHKRSLSLWQGLPGARATTITTPKLCQGLSAWTSTRRSTLTRSHKAPPLVASVAGRSPLHIVRSTTARGSHTFRAMVLRAWNPDRARGLATDDPRRQGEPLAGVAYRIPTRRYH